MRDRSKLLRTAAHFAMAGIAALGLARAATPQAFADEAVLLSSTTPGYVPGMVVTGADRLSLPDGASVTLLFQSGETVRLAGPFDGKLQPLQEQPPGTTAARFVELFRVGGVDASVVGGTRSAGQYLPNTATDDVEIDPARSSTYCVTPATTVWIMRPVGNQQSFALRHRGTVRPIAWTAGAARIEWPTDLPIDNDDSQFEVILDGVSRSTVSFKMMPGGSRGGLGQVATGILLGCQYQFDGMLRRARLAIVEPELWLTTDHGRRPAYRAGDAITLTVMANADGYLYCTAMGDDAMITPIFPAGAVDGAQIRASSVLAIPGSRQSVQLRAGPELRQIRCRLADRDLAADLPHVLVAGPPGHLSEHVTADIDRAFAGVASARVETAVVRIDTQ